MELRHLRYFLAVADALNFTKAAAQLRIAQPALSRRVRDLEDEIGVDLLKRSPRGVILTAEGKLFLEKTRQLLKLADESVEQVRALARGQFGDLHIGYGTSDQSKVRPFAYHNPIFVDVDGHGFKPNGDTLDWPLPVKKISVEAAKKMLKDRGLDANAPEVQAGL